MGSAHPLVEVNVSFKFEGNPFVSKGVIERTRIGYGRTDRRTDRPTRQSESSIATPHILWWGYKNVFVENVWPANLALFINVSTHCDEKVKWLDYNR